MNNKNEVLEKLKKDMEWLVYCSLDYVLCNFNEIEEEELKTLLQKADELFWKLDDKSDDTIFVYCDIAIIHKDIDKYNCLDEKKAMQLLVSEGLLKEYIEYSLEEEYADLEISVNNFYYRLLCIAEDKYEELKTDFKN